MSALTSLASRYRVELNPLRAERRVELVAVCLTGLFLLLLLYSGIRLSMLSAPEVIKPSLGSVADTEIPAPEPVSAELSEEIKARPLFWPSRRPPVPVVAEVAPPEEPVATTQLENVTLVGVFGGGDEGGIIALVQGKKRRILLGEEIQGWTLDVIEPERAEFSSGGGTRELNLAVKPPAGDKK